LNQFINSPSSLTYSYFIASTVLLVNSGAFYTAGSGRILFTSDDGTVYLDTNTFSYTSGQIYSLGSNSYTVSTNRIKINNDLNNVTTATNSFAVGGATYTLGTAAGNLINDNHASRTEMLLATLSSSGTGDSIRFSSSTGVRTIYHSTRLGQTTEDAIGFVRLSAPTTL
jgi:hypothetical protein